MSNKEATSRVAAVISELRRVVNAGLGAADETLDVPILASLELVAYEARSEDPLVRIAAIEAVVRDAIRSLGEAEAREDARLLFADHPETVSLSAKARRNRTADARGVDRRDFERNDQVRLLRVIARRIFQLEFEHMETMRRLGPPPTQRVVAASWLERFIHYRTIQHALRHLRHEVIEATVARERGHESGWLASLGTSLWYYAKFLLGRDEHIRQLGGIWLMPHAEADAAAQMSVNEVRWNSPFNEQADSVLRTFVSDVPRGELDPFLERLEQSPRGQELVGMWEAWLLECDVPIDDGHEGCNVHAVVDQANRYVAILDDQWSRILDILSGRG